MRASTGTSGNGLRKRSLMLNGHATSVALEPEFWSTIDAWAERERMSVASLIASVDQRRMGRSLASELRVAALAFALRCEPPAD